MPATPHTSHDPDILDLAELLPDLPTTVLITAPRQWADQCGYCPGPEDTVSAVPREALAFVCYLAPDVFDPSLAPWTYRDAVCPGCLPVALAQLQRRHPTVWVEVPTVHLCWCCYQPVCGDVCTPTRLTDGNCNVCMRPILFCVCGRRS